MIKIDLIIPCYNEAASLQEFFRETLAVTKMLDEFSFTYIFIDDGSRDQTREEILKISHENSFVQYIFLSRNFGKESAIFAGLKFSQGDYQLLIDADLQHPPSMIPDMIQGIKEDYDSVVARRSDHKCEPAFRRIFSRLFFNINNRISDTKLVRGAVDFRLISRKVTDAIISLSEVQRFSKGLFSWVGFNTKWIEYKNEIRKSGKTKWKIGKLFSYALTGITSFSIVPLRIVSIMGFFISLLSFIYIVYTLIRTFLYGIDVPGYVTTLCAVLFLGGITELSIGVLGEYIGNIYMETKKRPVFIMKETNIDPVVIKKVSSGE